MRYVYGSAPSIRLGELIDEINKRTNKPMAVITNGALPYDKQVQSQVKIVEHEKMNHAAEFLGGISIDLLETKRFNSRITDDYEAIFSIIKRHPMNQFEIEVFLKSRGCSNIEKLFNRLKKDDKVVSINYKVYDTSRLN